MRALIALLSLLAVALVPAQDEDKISKISLRYEQSRRTITEPPFGLHRVKKLLSRLKPADMETMTVNALRPRVYLSLSLQEKFTYVMLHGESVSQNCDSMPILEGEEHMVFAHPPDPFDYGNEYWSDRQTKFLHNHRALVVSLIRSTIRSRHQVGVNLKQAILELEAKELIPDMIAVYQAGQGRDQDILSTCMVLMKDGKYKPFMATVAYQTLYGPKSSYQSYLYADPGIKKTVIQDALAFSRSRT